MRPAAGEIRDEPLPPPRPATCVVRALYSGISRGTEALVFQGRVPPSEHQRMRAPFQAGDFPAPVKYGYASVGPSSDGPRDLRDRDVFVLYPHQTRYVVPAAAVHVLPAAVPPERAVLAANLETAINGLWDARAAASAIASASSAPARSAAWWRGWPGASPAATSSWSTSTRSARRSRERSACASPARTRIGERRPGDPRQRIAAPASSSRSASPASKRRSSR